jgi:hypothetical protein
MKSKPEDHVAVGLRKSEGCVDLEQVAKPLLSLHNGLFLGESQPDKVRR